MLQNIQALRAAAAYAVVFHHLATGFINRTTGWPAPQIGAAGVDIFFVVSGFIMVFTAADRGMAPGPFIQHRIARVVPLYWGVTILLFALCKAGFFPNGLSSADASLPNLMKSLTFWPIVRSSGHVFPLLTVGWTLNFEILFYCIFALSLAAKMALDSSWLVLIILSLLIFASSFVDESSPIIMQFFLSPILCEFAFGVALGIVFRYRNRFSVGILRNAGLLILSLGAVLLAAIVVLDLEPSGHSWARVAAWGLPASFIVFGALATQAGGLVVESRFVLFQGDASYAVYLTHLLVIQAMLTLLRPFIEAHTALQVAGITFTLFLAIVAAGSLTHRFVEKPLTLFLRRMIGRNQDDRPQPLTHQITDHQS